MKLIIQIPCLNEAETLPQVLHDIPRSVPGFRDVELLVIDDGSTDGTAEVARRLGVHHVLRNVQTIGLARSFRRGVDEALRLGADVIVNTDGDNQYFGGDIPALVAPILEGRAEIVVGDRGTGRIAHFSRGKRFLQWLGSAVVKRFAGVDVPDAVSGFRAFSREAAIRLHVISPFSYTIETLIQAGKKHLAVRSVPVRTNPKTRESRLFRSIPQFIERSVSTLVRVYTMFKPLKVFSAVGGMLTLAGLVPVARFVLLYLQGEGSGHVQSLVLGGVLLILGFVTFMFALLADLIAANRQLLEMTLERVKRVELAQRPQELPPPQALPGQRRAS